MTSQSTPTESGNSGAPQHADDSDLKSFVSYYRWTAIWTTVSAVLGLLAFFFGVFSLLLMPFFKQLIPKGMQPTWYIIFIQIMMLVGKAAFNGLLLYYSILILKRRFNVCNRLPLVWYSALVFELFSIIWGLINQFMMNMANLASQPQMSGPFSTELFVKVVMVLSILIWIFWYFAADVVPAFLSWRLQSKYAALSKKHTSPNEAIQQYLNDQTPGYYETSNEDSFKREEDGWQ